jgi:hypothetical protein
MRILPNIGHFRRLVYAAILSENSAGFDDQDFLELLSDSMWCLRNATRGFGEDARKFAAEHRPANLQDQASLDE